MTRKILVSVALIVLLLLLGAGVANYLVAHKPSPPTVQTQRVPLLVDSLEVQPQTVVEPIVGYGTARAERQTTVSAQVSGEVVHLADDLKAGRFFHKDELLVRIDDRDYRQQLAQAEAQLAANQAQLSQLDVKEQTLDQQIASVQAELASAEWELRRVKQLYENSVGIQKEYEDTRRMLERVRREVQSLESEKKLLPASRSQLEALSDARRAEVELARLNIERCTIKAPFDGSIETRNVDLGERVQVGMAVLSFVDVELIEVPIEMPASLRSRLETGRTCRLRLESGPEVSWEGRVKRISPTANEQTRTFEAYVEVDNTAAAAKLMPGCFVRATIDGPVLADVIVVPRAAIQQDQVYVFQDGLARARAIEVERHLLDRSAVRGLKPGEIVITSNTTSLFDGAPVRIATPTVSAAEEPANVVGLAKPIVEPN